MLTNQLAYLMSKADEVLAFTAFSLPERQILAGLAHLICQSQAPPKESKVLFLQYAALEENYGLARSAMEVYDKAIQTVPQNERLAVYDLYLARASDFFGIAKVTSCLGLSQTF